MAISKDLEPLIFKKFSARRQPWWRLEEFGPPNLECVPTPLINWPLRKIVTLFLRPYGNDINEEIKREPTRLFLKWNPGGIAGMTWGE